MMGKPHREFSWIEGIAICFAMIGIQLSSEVINQWGTYFYSPSVGVGRTVYVAVGIVGWIFIAGTVWDAMTGPIVGIWSDKTKTRPGWLRLLPIHGRRRPFVFWGSILMIFTAVAFWFPPVEGEATANLLYGTLLLCLHWTMFGIVLVPLNSLPPEIARSESERVRMGTFIAVGMIVGLAMAAVMPGELITRLDPARTKDRLVVSLPTGVSSEQTDSVLHALLPEETAETDLDPETICTMDAGGTTTIAFSGEFIGEVTGAHVDGGLSLVLSTLPQKNVLWTAGNFHRAARLATADTAVQAQLVDEARASASAALRGIPLPESAQDGVRRFVEDNLVAKFAPGGVDLVFYQDVINTLSLAEMRRVAGSALPGIDPESIMIVHDEGSFSATGYRRLAVVLAIVSLLCLQLPVWLVRERYDSEAVTREQAPFLSGLADALRNRAFVVYFISFFLFTVGFLAAQRALPYWAELGLGGDEGTVTLLMLPFILTAMLSYAVIPSLARRLHVKWMIFIAFLIIATGLPCMYIVGVADLGLTAKVILGAALFGYCGAGQGIMYVMMMPMIGEIIDYDEQISGERREALYNGLSGVAWKSAMAGSILIATQSMNCWGNSVRDFTGVLLVGPIAGAFAALGLVAILFYPRLNVTQEQQG